MAAKCPPLCYGVHFANANMQLAQEPQKVFDWLLQEGLSVRATVKGTLCYETTLVL